MFFLERKEREKAKDNAAGNRTGYVPVYRWKTIYACEERGPLEELLAHMDKKTHRIISNEPMEAE